MLAQGASVSVHSLGWSFLLIYAAGREGGGRRERGCPLEVLWYCWFVKSCRINNRNNTQLMFHLLFF